MEKSKIACLFTYIDNQHNEFRSVVVQHELAAWLIKKSAVHASGDPVLNQRSQVVQPFPFLDGKELTLSSKSEVWARPPRAWPRGGAALCGRVAGAGSVPPLPRLLLMGRGGGLQISSAGPVPGAMVAVLLAWLPEPMVQGRRES